MKLVRGIVVALYLAVALLPLLWMGITSIKEYEATISPFAKYVPASVAGVDSQSPTFAANLQAYRELAREFAGEKQTFFGHLWNSLIIGVLSTIASIVLGTSAAYGFSRFDVRGGKDWLFFILSTRFLPPLVVVVPIFLMFGKLGLQNSHLGLIILYTGFNLSLAVWLMKGFIDDIPRAYEDAARVDGYSRMQAFWRIIVPKARTGMAVTAVFCLISAWNEYGFAVNLNYHSGVTVPVYLAGLRGNIEGLPWPQIAAGSLLFVVPIVVFVALARNHLLRGVTFGTIKQ